MAWVDNPKGVPGKAALIENPPFLVVKQSQKTEIRYIGYNARIYILAS